MKNVYISNAFSLQMINPIIPINFSSVPVEMSEIPQDAVSAIGHADTAKVVSELLGWEVPANRINISLHPGDTLYVAQLVGGRLPEGCTKLPDGYNMIFYKVIINSLDPKCVNCPCLGGACYSNCTGVC